jgi:hypothetical protein
MTGMTQMPQEHLEALQAAGWSEEEVMGFAQTLAAFRDGLPAHQREGFNAIVAAAAAAEAGGDVQGYVVDFVLLGVVIGRAIARQDPLAPVIRRVVQGCQ